MVIAGLAQSMNVYAGGSGTEGAAFLDIPVGAGPAALGGSYAALAKDAYAATYNPAGLGFLDAPQFSGQHLSYLDTLHYEYLSFALPFKPSSDCATKEGCASTAIGGSVQYLGTGDVAGMDEAGTATGDFSSYYAAYNLALGHSFTDKISLGLTGKLITAKLADVSASAFAADLGGMYKVQSNLMLGATLTNLGSDLKFLDQPDSLPMAAHVGAGFRPDAHWLMTGEVVFPKTGLASFHSGLEWRPIDLLSLRTGFRTDTLKELSTLAGVSAGLGLNMWGQELAYAYLPYGDLGNTHYISLLMKFGEVDRAKRNLIQYQHIKKHQTVENSGTSDSNPDYMQLMELLNANDSHFAKTQGEGNVR